MDRELIKLCSGNLQIHEPINMDSPDAKLPENPGKGAIIAILSSKRIIDPLGVTITFRDGKWCIMTLTDEQYRATMAQWGLTEADLQDTRRKENVVWEWIKKQSG